jgi:hypothetical protein
MYAGNEQTPEIHEREESGAIDGAECCWDPWLISMYIDAVRSIEREARRRPPLH